MKIMLRKLFVSIAAVVTLGMYTPPIQVNTNTDSETDAKNKESVPSASAEDESSSFFTTEIEQASFIATLPQYEENVTTVLIDELMTTAKAQTILKMGPKITSQVESEFNELILPMMEEVITTVIQNSEVQQDSTPSYAITEQPTRGLGERIFNLYDERREEDIALFHVRRDHRPLEGYWFNFHYHLNDDNFEKHHHLGDIYWDKNIPPKWMA
ncbi:YpjP family protein [Virgibacillus sp. W0181]|uniref:YpjP family protein n=1 Tax=Virgibacillus sp. W0181 TaxID=3391581 RepID=UPI003F45807D